MSVQLTQSEKEIFLQLYREGDTVDKIALKTKRNKKTVLRALNKELGFKLKDPNRITKEQLMQFLSERKGIKEMMRYYRAGQYTIKDKIKEFGLMEVYDAYFPDMRRYGEDLEKQICALYEKNLSYKEICRILSIPEFLIQLARERHNMPIRERDEDCGRIHMLNHDFFEKIDSEEKAYFLGFLAADGCVHNNSNRTSIFIHTQDAYMIQKFSNMVYATPRDIYLPKQKNAAGLIFSSRKIHSDLCKHGITPQKTFTLQFPSEDSVPKHLIRHFIRGVFDGDGCIGVYRNGKRITFNFVCGSKDFIEEFRNHLLTVVESKARIIKAKNIYSLSYGAKEDVKKIFNFLYDDATIFLTRKHKKFTDFYK